MKLQVTLAAYLFQVTLGLTAIFEECDHPAPLQQATRMCEDKGMRLADPGSLTQHLISAGSGQYLGNQGYWTNLYKHTYRGWRTLRGAHYADYINYPRRIEGQDCTVLRTNDQIVDEIPCGDHAKAATGYLCSLHGPGSIICPKDAKCLQIKDVKYAAFYDSTSSTTWYQAVQLCKVKMLSLADVPVKDKDFFLTEIKSKLKRQGHFLVAMHHSIWSINGTGSQGIGERYNWARGEPSPMGECAIMQGDLLQWKVVGCNESYDFYCVSELEDKTYQESEDAILGRCIQLKINDSLQAETKCTCSSPSTPIWGVVLIVMVSVVILLVITLVLLLIYIIRRRSNAEHPRGGRQSNYRTNPENHTQTGPDEELQILGENEDLEESPTDTGDPQARPVNVACKLTAPVQL